MPKPRSDTITKWEMRLTPESHLKDDELNTYISKVADKFLEITKLIVCEEGGEGTEKRLHYHGYLETNASESHIREAIAELVGGRGNKFFMLKKAHELSIGYVVKEGNVKFRFNYDQTHIEEFIRNSQQYRAAREAERGRVKRDKKAFSTEVIDKAKKYFKDDPDRTIESVYEFIENEYEENKKSMPTRSSMELMIVNVIGGAMRKNYYLKSFLHY